MLDKVMGVIILFLIIFAEILAFYGWILKAVYLLTLSVLLFLALTCKEVKEK